METLGRVLRAGKAGTLGRALGRSSNSARKAVSDSVSELVSQKVRPRGQLGYGPQQRGLAFIQEETETTGR